MVKTMLSRSRYPTLKSGICENNWNFERENGSLQTESLNLYTCRQHRNTIPAAILKFSDLDNTEEIDWLELCPLYGHAPNQRWWLVTGSRTDITFISASIYATALTFQR